VRRYGIPIVVVLCGLLLLVPHVAGVLFLVILAAVLVGVPVLVGTRIRHKGGSLAPWMVSLVVSGVTVAAQAPFEAKYKHLAAHVPGNVVSWLLFAALLRFTIFLADLFRNRARPRV
jgi:hypothetical protein